MRSLPAKQTMRVVHSLTVLFHSFCSSISLSRCDNIHRSCYTSRLALSAYTCPRHVLQAQSGVGSITGTTLCRSCSLGLPNISPQLIDSTATPFSRVQSLAFNIKTANILSWFDEREEVGWMSSARTGNGLGQISHGSLSDPFSSSEISSPRLHDGALPVPEQRAMQPMGCNGDVNGPSRADDASRTCIMASGFLSQSERVHRRALHHTVPYN